MLSPGTLLRALHAPSLSAVNLVNDYFGDTSGLDADPEFAMNPFPLDSRVIQSGALSKRRVVVFAARCAGLALACGVLLNAAQSGNTALWIALATGAGRLVPAILALPYLLLAFAIATGALPGWVALSFLSLPFALLASRTALASPADPKRMTAAFASVFGLHFTGGILLAGGLLLAQRA